MRLLSLRWSAIALLGLFAVPMTGLPSVATAASSSPPSSATAIAQASAWSVRSCGNMPENTERLAILNVTTRGLSCPRARQAAVRLYHCASRQCLVVGLRFRCRNLGQGEAVDERCVAGRVVVRFQTGV